MDSFSGRKRRGRIMRRLTWTCFLIVSCAGVGWAGETVLPQGEAPASIRSPYFPDRVHEFVWRNWNAVEPAKLARILGASVEEVATLAESMGLPAIADVPPEMMDRGY